MVDTAVRLLVLVLGGRVALGVTRGVLSLPLAPLGPLDWTLLACACLAVLGSLWDRAPRVRWPELYGLGLAAVEMLGLQRGFAPGRYFVWGGLCDLAAFVLIAALLGWLLPRAPRVPAGLRIPAVKLRPVGRWFPPAQAALGLSVAALAGWIAVDTSFDGLGAGVALFGLTGRRAGSPASLMLVGACILMAWQSRPSASPGSDGISSSRGAWRAGWQYAAMAAGLLFTSSLGWSSPAISADTAASASVWLQRSERLLLSSAMITLMTGVGLGSVLPRHSDWGPRGRRAMPVFGALTVIVLASVVAQRLFWLASP